ncbi:hypothetical protein FRB99_004688 [Tulasnella sp. 403]|nr:hypothetical protein FRB99_004688 [Tulasnella sp. 403]
MLMLSTRPPVTPKEAGVLKALVSAFLAADKFYLPGEIENVGVEDPLLMYATKGRDVVKGVPINRATTEILEALHQDAEPSHFGMGNETVMDESYRLARELRADQLGFNFDPLSLRMGIVASIANFCNKPVEVVLYKLNSYTEGGLFKAHQDTPKGTNHIGTFLIGLPTPYEGGELVLRHGKETATIDWSTKGRDGNTNLPWAFFYADVEHEILPIKSGHRLTVAYDVYSTEKVQYTDPGTVASTRLEDTQLYGTLRVALGSAEFLPQGGKLAFSLAYQYTAEAMNRASYSWSKTSFDAILKGSDSILWHCLTRCGLEVEARAVYESERYSTDLQEEDIDKADGEGLRRYDVDAYSSIRPSNGSGPDYAFPTSSYFEGANDHGGLDEESGDDLRLEVLMEQANAKVELDLIWARHPRRFTKASSFPEMYGNESSNFNYDVAGALVVKVPGTRPPVTPKEADVIKALVSAFKAADEFYLSGEIENVGVEEPFLMYITKDRAAVKGVPINRATTDLLDTLHQDAEPSHFGMGNEAVMDKSYRLARELRADQFNFNFDPLSLRMGIVSSIANFCNKPVEVVLYKLNSYTEGGLFKAHQDTPKGTNHIGTFLIGLPTPFEGGELVLRHGKETATIDWSTKGRNGNTNLPWTFFYADVEHEILPVKSGHRLTVAYDVYSTKKVEYHDSSSIAATRLQDIQLYGVLRAALASADFLPQGGKLAFALAYQYTAKAMEDASENRLEVGFNGILKGCDSLLWYCSTRCGLNVEARAVYPDEQYNIDLQEKDINQADKDGLRRYNVDAYSSIRPSRDAGCDYAFPTSKYFWGANDHGGLDEESGDERRLEVIMEQAYAKVELDLIWARRPEEFTEASSFPQMYGNEPSNFDYDVAGALVIEVPPYGQGCRDAE